MSIISITKPANNFNFLVLTLHSVYRTLDSETSISAPKSDSGFLAFLMDCRSSSIENLAILNLPSTFTRHIWSYCSSQIAYFRKYIFFCQMLKSVNSIGCNRVPDGTCKSLEVSMPWPVSSF